MVVTVKQALDDEYLILKGDADKTQHLNQNRRDRRQSHQFSEDSEQRKYVSLDRGRKYVVWLPNKE